MWDSIEDVKVGTIIKIKPRHRPHLFSITDVFQNNKLSVAKIDRLEANRTYPIRISVKLSEGTNEKVDIDFHELCEHFELATANKIKKLGGDLYQ